MKEQSTHGKSLLSQSMLLPKEEVLALEDLFDSTTGSNWIWDVPYNQANGYPWSFSDPFYQNPCNGSYPWQGVTCSSDALALHISQLSLSERNLQGK